VPDVPDEVEADAVPVPFDAVPHMPVGVHAAGHDVGAITLGYDGDLVVAEVPAWP
jgi:sirohydrochlorin ferrochelatase